MKKYIFLAFLWGITSFCFGQQMPMFSQYAYNTLAINPAFAGTKDGVDCMMLFRKQWTNYEGAPTTLNFAAHSAVAKGKVGVGLNFVNDKIGISTNNTVQGAFSYLMPLNDKDLTLSFGLYLSVLNFKHDWGNLLIQNTNDPVFNQGNETLSTFNTGFGLYLYSSRYYVSFSIPTILETEMTKTSMNESLYRRHMFLKAGVHFFLSEHVDFVPSVLLKKVTNANLQADITATFIFQQMLWLGASYRSEDGIALMSQVVLKERFRIGYAYDYPFTEISNHTSGTHEILLGINIPTKQKANIVTSPRYF
ncbi:type IX secretion system membrane protein PorP/SprF [Flammeovirga sp. MY04]|uniref:PorP/SprF family type IX secretion system membrane protein n=1 Tax=Flammeovirga sp. MY04 TaxID=1191459 RepID=UPI000A05D77B|nr:type IX secretion system membrane protein PorP/SprF [Flammeovirga sp. MY04]ANQ52076.2 type IX secretion system membrane protein PorP/SprF [Flammeovirga sp. MY04]